ncbi:MAG: hypothetical protein AB8B95_15570 [Pseudohongiellaceae bacterium]
MTDAATPDALFADSQLLDLTLTGPFSLIDKERDKSKRYEGTLSYIDDNQSTVLLDVAYEVRGNWRLQKSNCSHAQLWLDLKRGQTKNTLFENQNRLKLVVQCGKQESKEQWLIKEQLAYDMFSEFSDYHFDTRLIQATYSDSLEKDQERTHFAFIIENQNRLAKRFDLEKFELNRAELTTLNSVQANRVALFMLLIGNTDFSLSSGAPNDSCCHNAKLLTDNSGVNYPFPYDFDASGFVDASYAAPPDPSMRINRNTQRLYRGYCAHIDNIEEEIERALETQGAVERMITDSEYASDRTKKKAIRFLTNYYDDLANERKNQRSIVGKCR